MDVMANFRTGADLQNICVVSQYQDIYNEIIVLSRVIPDISCV